MFRAALEFMLYKAGYQQRMLGPKIGQLEAAINDGTAPRWARDLDTNFLKIIKKLGDSGIHPNDGNIEAQAAFDTVLLIALDATFAELIYAIYEQEHDKGDRLATLNAALAVLEGRTAPAAAENDAVSMRAAGGRSECKGDGMASLRTRPWWFWLIVALIAYVVLGQLLDLFAPSEVMRLLVRIVLGLIIFVVAVSLASGLLMVMGSTGSSHHDSPTTTLQLR